MVHPSCPPPPLALFGWLPPGLSFLAEVIVLIGGFYGFWLFVQRVFGAGKQPAAPAPAAEPPPQPAAPQPAPAAPPAGPAIPPAELAVIGAVCHLVLTRPHRIVSIRQTAGPGDPWSGALDYLSWSREGRREIFTSHQLR